MERKRYVRSNPLWATAHTDDAGTVHIVSNDGYLLSMSAAMAEDLAESLKLHAKQARAFTKEVNSYGC